MQPLQVTAFVVFAIVAAAQPSPTLDALALAREAATATEANDHNLAVTKLEEAVALRPDMPSLLESLAIAQAAAGSAEGAVATLQRLVQMGVGASIDKADEFKPLRSRKDFSEVAKKLAANLHPKGSGEIAFTLREVTGLIEGIAWRAKTGAFYFADVNGRVVWQRAADGGLQRLTPEGDELLGVFALVVDEENGAIWAATSAVPQMRGYSPDQDGEVALAEVDLTSGAVRQTVPLAARAGDGGHLLGDLAVSPDGTIYLTDSKAPVIWRYVSGAKSIEPAVESLEFTSLQGVVLLSADVAIVADQLNGLLRVDLRGRQVQRLDPPTDTVLLGIDGLTIAPDGSLLALQSGVRPSRVLRIQIDAGGETIERVTVLDSGHLAMAAPSLGCIGPGGDFFFVANPGWNRFDDNGKPTAPRPVPIFRTKLGKGR